MAVKHEIKSQLAKLLATEDLIVEHKQVQTACFNDPHPCPYPSYVGEGKQHCV